MSPATRLLHQSLIRAAKMAIAAWEKWLNEPEKVPALLIPDGMVMCFSG